MARAGLDTADIASRRRRAALPGSAYDKFVALVKIVLPLAALALLLTIVIWPLTSGQEFSFLLSKDRVATSRERLRMARAVYRGTDSKGQPFVITATSAVQRTSDEPVVELRGLTAKLQMEDGPATVVADMGRYDLETDRLDIVGPVRLDSEAGYDLVTRDVTVDLTTRTAESGGPVTGNLPLGNFRAGRLQTSINDRRVILDRGAHLHIVQRRAR